MSQTQPAPSAHSITALRICNGQGSHDEVVYNSDQCEHGCPVCIALDNLSLMDRENNQLRVQLDSERSGQVRD